MRKLFRESSKSLPRALEPQLQDLVSAEKQAIKHQSKSVPKGRDLQQSTGKFTRERALQKGGGRSSRRQEAGRSTEHSLNPRSVSVLERNWESWLETVILRSEKMYTPAMRMTHRGASM